ncbi:MAG: hypothetical protein JJU41_09445 [Bacteroidetes bacterium]|nr:hypothetical protein [Bacteroidota bacterium]
MRTILFCLSVCGMLALMPLGVYAQFTPSTGGGQIQFGQFYSIEAGIHHTGQNELLFGNVIAGDIKTIEIDSPDAAIFEIKGLPFLDVIIEISGVGHALAGNVGSLFLDGDTDCSSTNCQMPVTYEFAFDNSGGITADDAVANPFTINRVIFPMQRRALGAPPGPPPTPEITGVDLLPEVVSTFLFIYGTIQSNSNNIPGEYAATLRIEVIYN